MSEDGSSVSGEREAADDLEDLFEFAPCGYLSAQPDSRIVRVNSTLAKWLGREPRELVGRRFPDLLNIAGKIYYETHFAPLLRMQGAFHEVALDLVRADGSLLPVLVNAVERQDANGSVRFIRITVFNASDRRRYEQELLEARRTAEDASAELRKLNADLEMRVAAAVEERMKAEEALRQAQKMEAIGQLTGGVAHDFNNLLTVILGGLDTIRRQVSTLPGSPTTERIERSIRMASHGAERAATLTARLLAFARRQPLEPKPIDAGRLVTNLADLLQRTLGETIALETVTGGGLWRAQADPGELENALVNLAVNARDAMPGGGRLTIETGNAHLDESYVAQVAEPVAAGQYVLIAVSDTGTGMCAATLAQVFEPFFTTKDVGKGTGLGLSQVYGFVRQSGGHIRIYSEVGEGTSVKIYLPRLLNEGLVPESETAAAAAVTHGGTETILVVEDHDDLRSFSTGILRELGYRVLEAANGRRALEALQAAHDVDLLFTDVVLPEGMDGRRLADEALRRRPGIKVLFTTGYTRNAIVHNGRLDPGVNLIGKPFSFENLAAKVREVLDS
ncbi:PAS domain-containing hybrid sensor histidine kinase/response regulator [Sphingomonas xinjiangensis]|uniref:histidine kinase n=1 Tax=Sphingomonas xinjiangensis TaxID=643568 RepID=A0A840YFS6_9SPHN|nr:PAS domain-containing hybrid sensor histidine kinase/response regulator [Sphingomonas xinjiangensis]MBB5712297.1 PAS domain S-box-containing protein [Sphingomonas xinjiangensis]